MRNLFGFFIGLFLSVSGWAQVPLAPLAVTLESASKIEDVCLVNAYFDMQSAGLTTDQSRMAALDSCVRPGFGRMQYAETLSIKYDLAQTEERLEQTQDFYFGVARRALARTLSACSRKSNRASCLAVLDQN